MGAIDRRSVAGLLGAALLLGAPAQAADLPREIRLDWATYNPVSIVLKEQGLLEKALETDGVRVRWVQSAGSNKALEFLNAGSLDLGSTAGAAALIARINGNPIKTVYVYSRPEWTALVTSKGSGITKVSDLKGKSVAVTRGTDPHIFLVRALQEAGLTEKDVRLVLLQHADGRLALSRGDVQAWAGLDPMMASAEIEEGAVLFFRKPAANTWGVLNVREEFAKQYPQAVERVLQAYETARTWSLAHPKEVAELLAKASGVPLAVAEKQMGERTDLRFNRVGAEQRDSILQAGLALQQAGVIEKEVDVTKTVDALLDDRFSGVLTQ